METLNLATPRRAVAPFRTSRRTFIQKNTTQQLQQQQQRSSSSGSCALLLLLPTAVGIDCLGMAGPGDG